MPSVSSSSLKLQILVVVRSSCFVYLHECRLKYDLTEALENVSGSKTTQASGIFISTVAVDVVVSRDDARCDRSRSIEGDGKIGGKGYGSTNTGLVDLGQVTHGLSEKWGPVDNIRGA